MNIDDDYFDSVFKELNKYDLDIDNSALYFIFDRDRQSNRPTPIMKNIQRFSNSRDNGENRNGLFLLSYPSAEAFYLNCFKDKEEFENGNDIKLYLENIKRTLNIDDITFGVEEAIEKLKSIFKDDFNTEWLDDFKDKNIEIFNYQERYFNKNKVYVTLSLLFLSLIDLGLVSIEENN